MIFSSSRSFHLFLSFPFLPFPSLPFSPFHFFSDFLVPHVAFIFLFLPFLLSHILSDFLVPPVPFIFPFLLFLPSHIISDFLVPHVPFIFPFLPSTSFYFLPSLAASKPVSHLPPLLPYPCIPDSTSHILFLPFRLKHQCKPSPFIRKNFRSSELRRFINI